MTLLTYPAVAERLSVSLSLVQTMAAAAEYAAELRTQKRRMEDIPPRYRPYLDTGFPRPVRLGLRVRRVRERELDKWIE